MKNRTLSGITRWVLAICAIGLILAVMAGVLWVGVPSAFQFGGWLVKHWLPTIGVVILIGIATYLGFYVYKRNQSPGNGRDEGKPTLWFRWYSLLVMIVSSLLAGGVIFSTTFKGGNWAIENSLTPILRVFKKDGRAIKVGWTPGENAPKQLLASYDYMTPLVTGIPAAIFALIGMWGVIKLSLVKASQFEFRIVNDFLVSHSEVYGGINGGWGLKPWWAKEMGKVSLKGKTIPFWGSFATKDGMWEGRAQFLIIPDPKRILQYFQKGAETAESEFLQMVSGVFVGEIAQKSTLELFGDIAGVIARVGAAFGDEAKANGDSVLSRFERTYGVDISRFQAGELIPDQKTLEVLRSHLETEQVAQMIIALTKKTDQGGPGLSPELAAKVARLAVGQLAQEQIYTIDMNPETARAIADAANAILHGGKGGNALSPVVAAIIAAAKKGGGKP